MKISNFTNTAHHSSVNYNKSRRQFLRRSTQAAIASMPLSMGALSQLAMAADNPKLKVIFAVIPDGFGVDPHGGYNGLWFPKANNGSLDTGNSGAYTLGEMSRHLGNYAKQSLFLQHTILSSGTGGHNGWQTILRDSAGRNTSVDIQLGNAMPGNNPSLKRIYSGPHSTVGAAWNISYQGSSMLRPETNPYTLYDAVLKPLEGSSSGNSAAPVDKSVLFDPALERLQSLRSQLTGSERAKLDTHMDAIEQVANDMQQQLPVAAECSPTAAQPTPSMNISSADYRQEVTRAHADVIATGLSCGTSRVATYQIGRSADPVVIKSVSSSRNPHDCAHRYGSVAEWRDSRAWYIHQVKYLLDQLNRMPDPDVSGDTLLDHTVVVLTSEMADGAPEHMQDVPVTLIGGASGLINTGNGQGRYYNMKNHGDRSHWKLGMAVDIQRVWTTLASTQGVNLGYGGDTSIIPGILNG